MWTASCIPDPRYSRVTIFTCNMFWLQGNLKIMAGFILYFPGIIYSPPRRPSAVSLGLPADPCSGWKEIIYKIIAKRLNLKKPLERHTAVLSFRGADVKWIRRLLHYYRHGRDDMLLIAGDHRITRDFWNFHKIKHLSLVIWSPYYGHHFNNLAYVFLYLK